MPVSKTLIGLPLERHYHLVLNHNQDVVAEDQKVRRVDHLRHRVSKLELSAHPMRLNPLTLDALPEEVLPPLEVERTLRRAHVLTMIDRRRAIDKYCQRHGQRPVM